MIITPLDWSLLCIASFFAALVQAATGFGFAVLAVPFFLLILNSLAAIQVVIIVNLVVSLILLPRLWRQAAPNLLGWLALGSFLGFPLGMALYMYANLTLIKLLVAAITLVMAAQLARSNTRLLTQNGFSNTGAGAVGLLSGTMAASLAMPGPSVLLYLTYIGADKQTLRATTLTLFLFSFGGALAAQMLFAGVPAASWKTAAVLTPLVILGAVCGHIASRWLSEAVFRAAVLSILAVTGVYLFVTTLFYS